MKKFISRISKNEFARSSIIVAIVSQIGGFVLAAFVPAVTDFLHIQSAWYVVWLYLIFATFFLSTVNLSVMQAYQLFVPSVVVTDIGMILRVGLGIVGALYGVGATLIS